MKFVTLDTKFRFYLWYYHKFKIGPVLRHLKVPKYCELDCSKLHIFNVEWLSQLVEWKNAHPYLHIHQSKSNSAMCLTFKTVSSPTKLPT